MSSHQFFTFIFVSFLFMMLILYILASLWDRFVTQSEKKTNDRKMLAELGEGKMTYSSDYFNKLTKPGKVGDNLPTRPCDKCGGPINPDEKFCPVCGHKVASWIEENRE